LRPEAILISPSSVRTAQAQAVGPCPSTPFRSALPPRRILSAISSRVVVGNLLEQRLQPRGGVATAELAAGDGDERHDLPHRRARERLIGSKEVREGERPLLDAVTGGACDRRDRA